MDRFLTQTQHIVVRGLLEDSGKVLIVVDQKPDLSYLEYYNLPGGIVPFGREPSEVLEDIFFEQTQVRIKVHAPLRTIHRMFGRGGTQIVEIIYRVKKQKNQSKTPRQEQCLWIHTDETGYFLSSCISDVFIESKEELR